ncbi:hypothetical protein AAY473_013730 [Plecturocebus cupreus]
MGKGHKQILLKRRQQAANKHMRKCSESLTIRRRKSKPPVSPCWQAGLELLKSGDLPASASQSAGITGVSHHARWADLQFLKHFGRPRWLDHLRSGVRDQPDQHGEAPSLLKIQKLARSLSSITFTPTLLIPLLRKMKPSFFIPALSIPNC